MVPQPGTPRASIHDVEAEDADVEAAHAVDVGGAQVDVADRDPGVDRAGGARQRDDAPLGWVSVLMPRSVPDVGGSATPAWGSGAGMTQQGGPASLSACGRRARSSRCAPATAL